jgi:hypothetical protein
MLYVRAVLVGLSGALIAAVLWTLVAFIGPIFLPMLIMRIRNEGGASGAVISSDSILLAALVGFVLAAVWTYRRG